MAKNCSPLNFEDFYVARQEEMADSGLSEAEIVREADRAQHDMLNKSMVVTNALSAAGSTGGDAIKIQDLIPKIRLETLTAQQHSQFYNNLHKKPAFSNVVEFVRATSVGKSRGGGQLDPNNETGATDATDGRVLKATLPMAWYGRQWRTFVPANAVTAITMTGGARPGGAEEVNRGLAMNDLMGDLNWASLHGDPEKNVLEMTGVIPQFRAPHDEANNVITRYDLKGKPFDISILPDLSEILQSKGGTSNELWFAPKTMADISKQLFSGQRSGYGDLSMNLSAHAAGTIVQTLGQDPEIARLRQDVHLNPEPNAKTVSDPGAPTKPGTVTVSVESATEANALGGYLAADNYYYWVAARGVKGLSDVRAGSGVAAVTSGDKAKLVITKTDANTISFTVYRASVNDVTKAKFLDRVSAAGVAQGQTVTYYDDGEFVPGCSTALIYTNLPSQDGHYDVELRSVYPITPVELPITAMTRTHILISGSTPQCWRPAFGLVVENIGRFE